MSSAIEVLDAPIPQEVHETPPHFAQMNSSYMSRMVEPLPGLHPVERLNGQRAIVHGLVEVINTSIYGPQELPDTHVVPNYDPDRNHQRLEAIQIASPEHAYELYDEAAFQLYHLQEKYGHLSPQEQFEQAKILIETVRSVPDRTNYSHTETSLFLLNLRNVGPEVTLFILQDLSWRAYSTADIPERRRSRTKSKARQDSLEKGPKFFDHYVQNILPTIDLTVAMGMNPLIAQDDRDAYCLLAKGITSSNIALMIGGGVTAQDVVHSMKYDTICKAAGNLLPPMGNEFIPAFSGQQVMFEWIQQQKNPLPVRQVEMKSQPVEVSPDFLPYPENPYSLDWE